MKTSKRKYTSIDEYIRSFPVDVQKKLSELRNIIRREIPEAEEKISYNIPAFFLDGGIVYFAGYAQHIGVYPVPRGNDAFQREASKYRSGKSTLQFSLEEKLPVELVKKVVRFRVEENPMKKRK